MDDSFWIKEPSILFRKDKLFQLWPYESMTFEEKLNATTRFVILISLVGFMLLNNYLILLFGIILILALICLFMYSDKRNYEAMENEIINENAKRTVENPLYNVMPTDYQNNVKKEELKLKYDTTQEETINQHVQNFILEENKDNKDIGNIFKSVTDKLDFDKSMRQFHTNPSTSIPNTQDDFLKYCYGDLPSCLLYTSDAADE